ncbi:hypothetical protein OUZ56_026278 [Daphnia magna]|uniref:Uncharacterized protein n=1 Tax=Daphnia magna TaxID=35525 RepID=A0ABQ9ZLA7_9CRUS|nr:hypothetical protein OUZ56_026278 [Daphnia magna]
MVTKIVTNWYKGNAPGFFSIVSYAKLSSQVTISLRFAAQSCLQIMHPYPILLGNNKKSARQKDGVALRILAITSLPVRCACRNRMANASVDQLRHNAAVGCCLFDDWKGPNGLVDQWARLPATRLRRPTTPRRIQRRVTTPPRLPNVE